MSETATIDVNGIRYDAVSGVVLGVASAPTVRRGHNIDGFFRARTVTSPRTVDIPPPPAEDTATIAAGPARLFHDVAGTPTPFKRTFTVEKPMSLAPLIQSAQRVINHTRARKPQIAEARTVHVNHHKTVTHKLEVRRGAPNSIHHRTQQHSAILRREYVPAPALTTHNALSPQHELRRDTPDLIEHKRVAVQVDPDRLARAAATPKHPAVNHHETMSPALMPTFAPVAVQPVPTDPVPTPPPGEGAVPVPPAPQPTNKPEDMFQKALVNASHFVDPKVHAAGYRSQARRHVASIAAGTLVLVGVAGFAAWQNSAALQIKTASIRSGVAASVPDLTGTGLSYNGVRSSNNKLVIGLTGAAGTMQITSVNSNLSSGDLIDEIGSTDASGTPQYRVLYAGRTAIYRFTNTGATWVKNGKWYSLTSNQAVSDARVKTIVSHL